MQWEWPANKKWSYLYGVFNADIAQRGFGLEVKVGKWGSQRVLYLGINWLLWCHSGMLLIYPLGIKRRGA